MGQERRHAKSTPHTIEPFTTTTRPYGRNSEGQRNDSAAVARGVCVKRKYGDARIAILEFWCIPVQHHVGEFSREL